MRVQIGWIVCTTAVYAATCCYAADPLRLPPNPRLLLDRSDISALQQKIAGPFSVQWSDWIARADRLVSTPVELPPRGGNYSHNYVCPVHGARLKRGKKIGPWQWEHICPVGNHILRGDPANATLDFDGNAISQVHLDLADAVVTLGVAYQVTGNQRYAQRARDILLAYAEKYETYAIHDNHGKVGGKEGGHVASQALTEASWLIPFTQGADLVWDVLTPADRAGVADKVMRPALNEIILPMNYGLHNIQCRWDSAIGLVGYLLNDANLVHIAIDDPKKGFRRQIAGGVQDDGMWLEGSAGYHFFTIEGLIPLAEAARHCGIDLYSERFKSMFDGPVVLAMPNMQLPNFNDSSIVELQSQSDAYDLAYARWKNPAYLNILAQSKRAGTLSLLYGLPSLPAAPSTDATSPSHNSKASGYAILRSAGGRDATWLSIKYGPHGGAHGHPDKNTFILYSRGSILAADAGVHAYGSPLHAGWDQTTIAHNTLVVDETSQAPATGKFLAFGSDAGVDYVMTDAGAIYPEKRVRFIRTVALLDANTIVGVDCASSDGKSHTFDIPFHLPGKWFTPCAGEPWPTKDKVGYQFLEHPLIRQVAGSPSLQVAHQNRLLTLTLCASTTPVSVMTGEGIGETTQDRVPTVIFRRTGPAASFIWVIGLNGNQPAIAGSETSPGIFAVTVGSKGLDVDTVKCAVSVHKSNQR